MRIRGNGRELGPSVHHGIRPEIPAGDVEADPRVTAHVIRLGPVVGGRDADGLLRGVPAIVNVGQLRPPVFPEGYQHSLPLPGNQLSKPVGNHGPRTTPVRLMFLAALGYYDSGCGLEF